MITQETLKITWKFIRRKGYGRTPKTYCTYVAENEKHKHKLRTYEESELFKLLQNTVISKNPKYAHSVFVQGTYSNGKLISVTKPVKI